MFYFWAILREQKQGVNASMRSKIHTDIKYTNKLQLRTHPPVIVKHDNLFEGIPLTHSGLVFSFLF